MFVQMATNDKNVISILREHLDGDNLSLFYQGKFDHKFTALIIDLARNASETLTNRTGKNRMGFLMAESFQNIVKHGLDKNSLTGVSKEVFGIRNIGPFMHIFSSNQVDPDTGQLLHGKLSSLDNMGLDDLNKKYIEILKNGDISDKGGAGLGLIEMARKSKQPLQHAIVPAKGTDEKCGFGLQIDMLMDKSLLGNEPDKLSLHSNVALHEALQKENVILLFNGDFSKETIAPVLDILRRNAENSLVEKKKFSKLYHIAVELFQNVIRHGASFHGVKFGTFVLAVNGELLSLSTGNYVTEEQGKYLSECIEHLNGFPPEGLDALYMETLRASAREESGGGNVGMIDIARISAKNMEYDSVVDENGTFFSITAHFK